jgi:flagellar hook protein FlgE
MIESILVGMSGMQGHQRGLSIIGNNVSNMNTLGFRGSTATFVDVFTGAGSGARSIGGEAGGVAAVLRLVDTQPGDPQRTDRDHDLSLDGTGFFIVQDETGAIRYTRNGALEFVDGELVTRVRRLKVMTRNDAGQLVPFETTSLRQSPPKATSKVTFDGTTELGQSDQEHTIESLVVHDKAGRKHTLKVDFDKEPQNQGNLTRWKVTVSEGLMELASGEIGFVNQNLQTDEPMSLRLAFEGADPIDVVFDFAGVTLEPGSSTSTVAVKEQDGFGVGEITSQTFDPQGLLKLAYSNGQEADGPKLTFAVIADETELVQLGGSLFQYKGTEPVVLREAGDDLKVATRSLEGSNVDLTEEFSELILMQRGYQASSQVVSTANEMLQELLQLKGRR